MQIITNDYMDKLKLQTHNIVDENYNVPNN